VEVLESLLADAKGVLQAVGRRSKLNTEMIVLCEEGIRDPTSLLMISDRIARVAQKASAIDVHPPTYLMLYLPSVYMSYLNSPLAQLAAVEEMEGLKRIWQMSQAIRARRDADSAMAGELSLFIARIHAQLDLLIGAETQTENVAKNRRSLPEKPEIIELVRRMKRQGNQGRTQIDIALEVADGDKRKAEAMLRTLRNHRHLLDD
jgi:hypothetical protein